ncbi:MAG: TonB-dependent receptor [Sphingobium sp.]
MAVPVFAQNSQPAQPATTTGGLEDIVVTARRVAENLQNVPVAVTAFTGEQLERQNARSVIDIARQTPGLTIRESTNSENAATFSIRGQVQTDILATTDPSVGVYVDDFYWARAYGVNADLLDIQSAQTLKGPQGTLFGRNTTGGAILLRTNDPDTSAFSGNISATYGRFDHRIGSVVLNVPLVQDRVAVRGAFRIEKRDGYVTNIVNGEKLAERDNWTGRLKLLAKPTETLSVLLSAEIYDTDVNQRGYQLTQISPNLAAAEIGFESGATSFPTAIGTGVTIGNDLIDYLRDNPNRVALNDPTASGAKTHTYTGTVTLDTFFGAVKFVGGYRRVNGFNSLDLDGTPFPVLTSAGTQRLSQYSGEAQITGSTADSAVDFAAGVFYFHESGTDMTRSLALPVISGSTNPNIQSGFIVNDSQGAYAQASWHITDALTFTGGLRYSVEDKALTIRNRTETPGGAVVRCTVGGALIANLCAVRRKDDFDGWSYTAGLDYRINPDVLIYAKTARGFRSGGQNLRATATTNFIPFGPETATSYEGGFKSELFDRRARFNVAAYYTEVKGIQRSILTPTNPPATLIQNAGKARIYGLEAELTVIPFEGLELAASGAITKPKYLNYFEGTKDRRTDRFETIPEQTATFAATYTTDIGAGTLMLRGDYIYTAKYFSGPYNEPSDPFNQAVIDGTTVPASQIVNGRASLTLMDDALEIAVWGRNLTNNRDIDAGLLLPPGATGLGYSVGVRREPRTFGITGTYRFGQ